MSRLTYAVVIPAIDPVLAHDCIASMHPAVRAATLLVDNTGCDRIGHVHRSKVVEVFAATSNLGVPVSWNRGIAFARAYDVEYLVILSQSIRFGRMGGVDFLAELEQRRPKAFCGSQFGWKLCALPVRIFEEVGLFDPIFWPAYNEEIDFMWRMHLAGLPSPRANGREFDQVTVDATSAGDAMTLKRRLVEVDFGENAATFAAKWGRSVDVGPILWQTLKGLWSHPYNDPALDLRFVGARQ